MSRQSLIAVAITVALVLTIIAVKGCSGYGTVSPTTYQYAKALYAVCNRKDADGLDSAFNMIGESAEAGEISSREFGWLSEIVDQGRTGEWLEAQKMARQLMSDQADL